MTGARILFASAITAAATTVLLLATSNAGAQTPGPDTPIPLLAIDAITEGNTATALGPIDNCVRAEAGAPVTVDLIADAIPEDRGMIAFQMAIEYDPAVLEVSAYDQKWLLAAEGRFEPFEAFNDQVPDTDGKLNMGILDIASNDGGPMVNSESGPGVLVRVTFQAKSAGISTVSITPAADDGYPAIMDYVNNLTEIEKLGAAKIAVGQDCPPIAPGELITTLPPLDTIFPSTPTPEPTATPGGTPAPIISTADADDGGPGAGVIAMAAVLGGGGLASVASGSWLLWRRRGGPKA